MKNVLVILLLCCFYVGIAQNSNKKKVLVVPYGRFEFVSAYTLEEIALKNNVLPSEVFYAYQSTLMSAFGTFQSESFDFVPLTATQLAPFKKYITYFNAKFKGRNYYALKMKGFPRKDFEALMGRYDANFIVFVNWYQIKKTILSSRNEKEIRIKYAKHYVDYEIYNLLQERIIGAGGQEIDLKKPTTATANFSALRLQEIEKGYVNFVMDIVTQLKNPIQNK